MNILPKKRWHVRTKDNIARVRRDEAQAAQEEKERERRAQLAEQEARTSFLRQHANDRLHQSANATVASLDDRFTSSTAIVAAVDSSAAIVSSTEPLEHVSFISESDKDQKQWGANKEREEEKKQEQEKYEKSIGLLTYLGQTVLDSKGEQPWYAKRRPEAAFVADGPGVSDGKDAAKNKIKNLLDPLNDMNKYLKMIKPAESTTNIKKKPPISRTEPVTMKQTNISTPDTILNRPALSIPIPEVSIRRQEKHSKRHKTKKSKKTKKKKSKKSSHKRKRSSSSSSGDESDDVTAAADQLKIAKLEQLRAERLRRELLERSRAEKLVAMSRRQGASSDQTKQGSLPPSDGRQKYNSQFNPHLAKKPRLEL